MGPLDQQLRSTVDDRLCQLLDTDIAVSGTSGANSPPDAAAMQSEASSSLATGQQHQQQQPKEGSGSGTAAAGQSRSEHVKLVAALASFADIGYAPKRASFQIFNVLSIAVPLLSAQQLASCARSCAELHYYSAKFAFCLQVEAAARVATAREKHLNTPPGQSDASLIASFEVGVLLWAYAWLGQQPTTLLQALSPEPETQSWLLANLNPLEAVDILFALTVLQPASPLIAPLAQLTSSIPANLPLDPRRLMQLTLCRRLLLAERQLVLPLEPSLGQAADRALTDRWCMQGAHYQATARVCTLLSQRDIAAAVAGGVEHADEGNSSGESPPPPLWPYHLEVALPQDDPAASPDSGCAGHTRLLYVVLDQDEVAPISQPGGMAMLEIRLLIKRKLGRDGGVSVIQASAVRELDALADADTKENSDFLGRLLSGEMM